MSVTITGLDQLEKFVGTLRALQIRLLLNAKSATAQISAHLAERARVNAPILTGRLIEELVPIPTTLTAGGIHGGVVSPVSKGGVYYGAEIHEKQVPKGAKYQLGPKTRQKPPTEEGGPGGGHIDRVAEYHLHRTGGYIEIMRKAVEAALQSRELSSGEIIL